MGVGDKVKQAVGKVVNKTSEPESDTGGTVSTDEIERAKQGLHCVLSWNVKDWEAQLASQPLLIRIFSKVLDVVPQNLRELGKKRGDLEKRLSLTPDTNIEEVLSAYENSKRGTKRPADSESQSPKKVKCTFTEKDAKEAVETLKKSVEDTESLLEKNGELLNVTVSNIRCQVQEGKSLEELRSAAVDDWKKIQQQQSNINFVTVMHDFEASKYIVALKKQHLERDDKEWSKSLKDMNLPRVTAGSYLRLHRTVLAFPRLLSARYGLHNFRNETKVSHLCKAMATDSFWTEKSKVHTVAFKFEGTHLYPAPNLVAQADYATASASKK